MLDSPLIDVAIGLSLVFLLLSLLVSSVCEMLAGLFRWRAQYLWSGLEILLQSPDARTRLYNHPLIKGLAPMTVMNTPLSGRFGQLRERIGLRFGDGPSYIPSRTFALALIDVIRQPHAIAAGVEARIDSLVQMARRSPLALAASFAQLVQEAEQGAAKQPADLALAAVLPRLRDLQSRLFQPVDASVLASLIWQVESVIAAVPTSGQGSLGPVSDWLAQAPRARNYVELRAALVDALPAMTVSQPAARECRATLDAIVANFQPGSPAEVARELQQLLDQSKQLGHALAAPAAQLERLAGSLGPLLDDAAGDIERFRQNVEMWFNDSMDRVSGAYKRHTMAWQAGIGLVLAIVMNVDAVQVTRSLWHDSALRQVLVAEASTMAKQDAPSGGTASDFGNVTAQVKALGLPIGWRGCPAKPASLARNAGSGRSAADSATAAQPAGVSAGGQPDAAGAADDAGTPLFWCGDDASWALALLPMLLGWCLTAAAVSLGAPFWFDTLKRFVSIRSAGKAPEEAPTPPKKVPQPREAGERP